MRAVLIVCVVVVSHGAFAEEGKKARKQAKAAAVVANAQPALVAPQPSVGSLLFVQTQPQPNMQLTPVAFRVRKAPAGDSLAQALKVARDHRMDTHSIPAASE